MGIFDFLWGNQQKKRPKTAPYGRFTLDGQDKMVVLQKWHEILKMLDAGGPSHFRQAVLESDKLTNFVLGRMQISGETMGQRLKSAGNRFSPKIYQGLWDAHKIRNRLVHEMDNEILNYEAKEAIEKYQAALKDLGVI